MARATKKTDFIDRARTLVPTEEIHVPEWDRTVYVRALSARSMRRILESCLKEGKTMEDDDAYDNEALNDRMIGACLVDEKGERIFPVGRENEIEDVLANRLYQQIAMATNRVNRSSDDAGN